MSWGVCIRQLRQRYNPFGIYPRCAGWRRKSCAPSSTESRYSALIRALQRRVAESRHEQNNIHCRRGAREAFATSPSTRGTVHSVGSKCVPSQLLAIRFASDDRTPSYACAERPCSASTRSKGHTYTQASESVVFRMESAVNRLAFSGVPIFCAQCYEIAPYHTPTVRGHRRPNDEGVGNGTALSF
jgi:hypothetical protein